ncbi:CapA family protein [bacterium]|nr:CapA family protein [bacterium]
MRDKLSQWLLFSLTWPATVIYGITAQTSLLFCQTKDNPAIHNYYSTGKTPELSVIAVGDVMLGSWVTPIINARGVDYPFEKTARYIQSATFAIANLEAPFTLDGKPFEKKFNFKVPPAHSAGLRSAGFDIVTLANNHILDYGETGLHSTIGTLREVGLEHCGAGSNLEEAHRPAVLHSDGKKVAFFGYSMTYPKQFYAKVDSAGTAYPEPELMAANLQAWRDSVDFIVVSFHWGAEKSETPKDYQIFFAHLAIDNGADLVLGHHPHVLQGLEIYRNRLIAYSLGNFAFGSYSKYATDSIILKVYLNHEGLFYARCLPINVDNREVEFQPVVVEGERREKTLSKLRKLSLSLNQRDIIDPSGMIWGNWHTFYNEWLVDKVIRGYLPLLSTDKFPDRRQESRGYGGSLKWN